MSSSTTSMSRGWAADWPLAVLGLIAVIAIWPGISGFAIAPRWAALAVGAPLLLCFCPIRMTVVHWLGAAFLLYAIVSLAWAPVKVEAFQGLAFFIILAVGFWLGASPRVRQLRPFYLLLAIGVAINAVIAVAQVLGFNPVEEIAPPGGLFANKNMLGEIAALALIGCVAGRLAWYYTIAPIVCLVLTACWGAIAGVAAAGVLLIARQSLLWAAIAGVIVLLAFDGLLATNSSARNSVTLRGWITLDAIGNLRWFGHGVGEYWVTTPQNAPRQEALNVRHWHAHNDSLEAIYDYGVGAAFYFAFIASCLWLAAPAERLVLAGFLVIGLVGFPLYAPATAFTAAVVAGFAAGGGHRVRNDLDDGADHRGQRHAGTLALRDPHEIPDRCAEAFSARSLPARATGTRGRSLPFHAAKIGGAAHDRFDAGQRPVGLGPAAEPAGNR